MRKLIFIALLSCSVMVVKSDEMSAKAMAKVAALFNDSPSVAIDFEMEKQEGRLVLDGERYYLSLSDGDREIFYDGKKSYTVNVANKEIFEESRHFPIAEQFSEIVNSVAKDGSYKGLTIYKSKQCSQIDAVILDAPMTLYLDQDGTLLSIVSDNATVDIKSIKENITIPVDLIDPKSEKYEGFKAIKLGK